MAQKMQFILCSLRFFIKKYLKSTNKQSNNLKPKYAYL